MTDGSNEATHDADGPLVTVALRAFNSRGFIRAALDGAVAQTYRPLEIVVCDDGSTDGTHTEIERYLTEISTEIPTRFVRHSTNLGVGAALDTIVANSRGEYLMIADGDDISLPGRVAECIDTVRKMGPDCLGGRAVPVERIGDAVAHVLENPPGDGRTGAHAARFGLGPFTAQLAALTASFAPAGGRADKFKASRAT